MNEEQKIQYGNMILENTQRILKRGNDTTYVDFWNLALSNCLLTQNKKEIEDLLKKSKQKDSVKYNSIIRDYIHYYGGFEKTPFYQIVDKTMFESKEEITEKPLDSKFNKKTDCYNTSSDNKINIILVEKLRLAYRRDQKYRKHNDFLSNKILLQKQKQIDNNNSIFLKKIFHKYGYLGKTLVGDCYSSYSAILLAHTNDLNILKELFPYVKEAYRNHEIKEGIYMLLVDKYHWRLENLQIFGTQRNIPFYPKKELKDLKEKYLERI